MNSRGAVADIAVTFYNVAEMASEARRRRQLEQEAISLNNNNNHTKDELAAAVGLIMLRYQSSDADITQSGTVSQLAPTSRPIAVQTQPVPQFEYQTRKRKSTVTRINLQSCAIDDVKPNKDLTVKLKPNANSSSSNNNSASKSSLLTSCRNILKEFLSQNSQ